jgi:hypothetical protein
VATERDLAIQNTVTSGGSVQCLTLRLQSLAARKRSFRARSRARNTWNAGAARVRDARHSAFHRSGQASPTGSSAPTCALGGTPKRSRYARLKYDSDSNPTE